MAGLLEILRAQQQGEDEPLPLDLLSPPEIAAMRQRRFAQGFRPEGRATRTIERTPDMVGQILASMYGIPGRAMQQASALQRGGEYNPAPVVDAASMMIGRPVLRPAEQIYYSVLRNMLKEKERDRGQRDD